MSFSFVDGFVFIGVGCFTVIMFIDGEGDFVDFNFQILDDVFFGFTSNQEMSVFQQSQVSLDLIVDFFFDAVHVGGFSNCG